MSVEFKASDFPNSNLEQPKVEQEFNFPYTADKEKGELEVVGTAENEKRTKKKSTDPLVIAQGCITTSRLVRDVYYIGYAPHGYDNSEELIPTYVEFYFDKVDYSLWFLSCPTNYSTGSQALSSWARSSARREA